MHKKQRSDFENEKNGDVKAQGTSQITFDAKKWRSRLQRSGKRAYGESGWNYSMTNCVYHCFWCWGHKAEVYRNSTTCVQPIPRNVWVCDERKPVLYLFVLCQPKPGDEENSLLQKKIYFFRIYILWTLCTKLHKGLINSQLIKTLGDFVSRVFSRNFLPQEKDRQIFFIIGICENSINFQRVHFWKC